MQEELNFVVSSELGNTRLDKAACVLSSLSRSRIQNLIYENCVKLNNIVTTDQDIKVKDGDIIIISIPEAKLTTIAPKDIEFEVVYEDECLIVINKPAGLSVHPGAGNYDNTLVNALVKYCGDNLSEIGGIMRPGIVHRLDKDTSGLMVVAKNDISHISLSKQIAARSMKRVYNAVIWGVPIKTKALIETCIGRSSLNRMQMKVCKQGKFASTEYILIKILDHKIASIVECRLGTGRTHQIRVHMSYIGHSIIGDQTYGHNKRKINHYLSPEKQLQLENFKRQALHSTELNFLHPLDSREMHFRANFPEDIQNLIKVLDESFSRGL
jgi:23S rRNA pseudouridine1911/1915/1917 synthase